MPLTVAFWGTSDKMDAVPRFAYTGPFATIENFCGFRHFVNREFTLSPPATTPFLLCNEGGPYQVNDDQLVSSIVRTQMDTRIHSQNGYVFVVRRTGESAGCALQ